MKIEFVSFDVTIDPNSNQSCKASLIVDGFPMSVQGDMLIMHSKGIEVAIKNMKSLASTLQYVEKKLNGDQ
jgi:hypothetical protein